MVEILHQPALIKLGLGTETASLLFVGVELLAIVVFLDPAKFLNDPDISGKWSVEAGFGACDVGKTTVLFESLEDATTWAAECYSAKPSNRAYSASGAP